MVDMEKKQERRRHRRQRVDISIEARIIDISESGILVETNLMPKKGTLVTVTIDGLQFGAIVRHEIAGRKSNSRGFGAEFQMLTVEHNEKIRKVMTRIPKKKEDRRIRSKETPSSIILVDGDSMSRMIYGNRLGKGGFNVIAVPSFHNIHEMLQQGGIAAVVCDYTSDTIKEIELIRKNHAELAICVLSLRGDASLEQLKKLRVTYKSKALINPEKFFQYIEKLLQK
jgi:CheY-like chemotaxis protein